MNSEIKNLARDLRKNETKYEDIFWDIVRNRRFFGKKFLRQHPMKVNYFGE